jgi:predicted unusual protein kinase regulating ubiquinone biosynthesis (AarF/ABC1/UbiB family)
MKLARLAAPYAIHRLIQLMDSEDERVAAVACNSILDRAFGKPKIAEEKDDLAARVAAMTPEERLARAEELIASGKRFLPLLERVEAELDAAHDDEQVKAPRTDG